ncbi:MAG TPA: CvpA family protein [Candidatus Binataceae bacterium]|nr:CvpA family protein [Candidatus Binataceae bacterium]
MSSLNKLDYAIIAIVVLGGLYGLSRGVIRMAASILSIILGLAAASAWYERVGAWVQQHLNTSPTVSAVIGYVVTFLAVAALIGMAGQRVVRLAHVINLNLIDRLGGAVFGAALAAVFVGVDLLILAAVLPPDSSLIRDSRLAPRVLAYNQSLATFVPPEMKAVFQRKYDDLVRYWNGQNQSPADAPARAPGGT